MIKDVELNLSTVVVQPVTKVEVGIEKRPQGKSFQELLDEQNELKRKSLENEKVDQTKEFKTPTFDQQYALIGQLLYSSMKKKSDEE